MRFRDKVPSFLASSSWAATRGSSNVTWRNLLSVIRDSTSKPILVKATKSLKGLAMSFKVGIKLLPQAISTRNSLPACLPLSSWDFSDCHLCAGAVACKIILLSHKYLDSAWMTAAKCRPFFVCSLACCNSPFCLAMVALPLSSVSLPDALGFSTKVLISMLVSSLLMYPSCKPK
jgi:hypothetical protein